MVAPVAVVEERGVSTGGMNSQGVGFETAVSAQPLNRGAGGSGETGRRERARQSESGAFWAHLQGLDVGADGRGSAGRAG